MTLCIASLAQDSGDPRIVLCFDSKISNDAFGSETEYKFQRLSGQLVSMFAGAPGRAKELALIYRGFLTDNALDPQRVVDQLREPVALMKRRLANAYVGRTMGLSYDEVLEHGLQWFGEERERRFLAIESHDLSVDLIIAGFIDRLPVLCRLQGGEVEWETTFSVIGSGAHTATPALHARKQTDMTALLATLYNVYEAKRMGEASPYVGIQTAMLVLQPGDEDRGRIGISVVPPEGLNFLADMFKEYGPKPWPEAGRYDLPKNALIRTQ